MSSGNTIFGDVELARGRPYAERGDSEPAFHDRIAVALHGSTVGLVAGAISRGYGDLSRIVAATAAWEERFEGLSDPDLQAMAVGLRERLRRTGFVFECVAECFALVRIAAVRTIAQRHYDTQLIAGYGLLRGLLVEMATGEGKTICATLPACTVAIAGYPVHVITVNDYLARRDAEKMQPVYDFLGLSVGTVVQGLDKNLRRQAYACSVTYCTNKELAFDYLRDRVATQGRSSRLHQALRRLGGSDSGQEGLVLRGLHYAIVDEADSVFVDEARTPLILSATGAGTEEGADCAAALEFAASLIAGEDYAVNPFERRVSLHGPGLAKLEQYVAGRQGIWTSIRGREELIRQALSALHLYRLDQHYVVVEGKVQIVDESTGRVMPDRAWERGLHQMIETKEGVVPTPRRETLARLTYQRLFRRYVHLSGMTGTAAEVSREIKAVYGIDVARVPLHRPLRRVYQGATFCPSLEDKWNRVADVASSLALGAGRPVLIGTRSVEASEQLSAVLTRKGVRHALLNAKQDAVEAEVIAQAGQPGRVTVATNMAGRGTDIELGDGVESKGGLHVILTEYHDSRRVDRQLFGRCARQGDAGSCEAIVSLEDDIFAVCVPLASAMLRHAARAGIMVPIMFRALRVLAQRSAERRDAAIRKQNLKQDRQLNRALAFTGTGE
ncbi:MAG: prepilin peptidase [Burkholderiaceae bacterium]|nr:prepilin peptidase [Burkholderiaceae bacterium]